MRGKIGDTWTADVGYERFFVLEVFFEFEIYLLDYIILLLELVY